MRRLGRLLLFLLPLSASFGPMVSVAGLSLARVVAAGLVGAALMSLPRRVPRAALWVLLLTVVWVGWGFARLDPRVGMSEVLSVALGMASVLGCLLLMGDRLDLSPDGEGIGWLRTMVRGWMLAWFATCLPAIREIVTGEHLANYREDAPLWIRESATDIASYMVNPNLFAFLLAAAMGMLMIGFTIERGVLRWVCAACVLASPVICWFTNSRLIVLVVFVYLAWFLLQFGWLRRMRRLGAVVVGLGLLAWLVRWMTAPWGVPHQDVGSNAQRLGLYRNGWYLTWSSGGLGIGPAQFERAIATGRAPYDIHNGPVNPHSGLLELTSQYGLLVAAGVLALVSVMVLLGWQGLVSRWSCPLQSGLRWNLLVLAAMLVPASFANSSYLDMSVAFTQVAGLAMVANLLRESPARRLPRWQHHAAAPVPAHRRLLRRRAGA